MNERINKIQSFAMRRDAAEAEALRKKNEHITDMLRRVRELAPRLHELMEIGRALYENGIPLGPQGGYLETTPKFVSNGWSHHVGFIVEFRTWRPIGFGIIGGGACGNDLLFNEDGEISGVPTQNGNVPGVFGRPWDDSDIMHLERFLRDFDEFEKGFYEYVDGLK